jgi:FtsP/CotA-like multicopper oxidase with cupredoxin domain
MRKAFLLLLAALPLAAQSPAPTPPSASQPLTSSISCGNGFIGGDLLDVPEINNRVGGVLSGTLYTVSEQVRMPTGGEGSFPKCHPQWVRAYRKDAPANWNLPASMIGNPMPGPTLRARVGDVVNLTFLNAIDANKFPISDQGCDETNVYPGKTGDEYPDCFADSVFTNVHYHGTHTSPNTTGDNVFLTIRPTPRDPANDNMPRITAADVKKNFDDFYAACNAQLKPATGPKMWPTSWRELDKALQDQLMGYVQKYGVKTDKVDWFASNQKLISNGYWPQYFVGAYPYCFKLPEWTGTTISTASSEVRTPHSHGAGSSEVNEAEDPQRLLIMGQSPGTHWYHAHKHGSTTINVMNGMTGVFVIEGDSYDKPIKDYYRKNYGEGKLIEKVLVVQQLGSVPNLITDKRGDVNFFVNGRFDPVQKMAGNSVMWWRIANTAGRAGVFFRSPEKNGLQWKQMAVDGVQLSPHNYSTRPDHFLLMSGNRVDLLVKAPAYKPGGDNRYTVWVYNTVDPSDRPPANPGGTPLTLLTVEVTPDGPDMAFIPESEAPKLPAFLDDVTDKELRGTKILKFTTAKKGDNSAPSQMIDGNLFNGELGAVVELNRAEEWTIVNESYKADRSKPISHPFHIHINPFQLTEIFDPNVDLSTVPGPGTVSVTEDQLTVTGVKTSFYTDFHVGDAILINNSVRGEIKSIDGDFLMTLTAGASKTIAGGKYAVVIPLYTIDEANKRPDQCVLDPDKPSTFVPCRESEKEPLSGRVWWDVFPIPSGKVFRSGTKTAEIPGHFKMRSRFVDYSGYFVLHCHILAHEDRGMMTVVEVTPLQTPFSHH